MKKFIFLFIIILIPLFLSSSYAQTKTPTPTDSLIQEQVNELQTKIASKVAQLNLVEKRGVLGTVTQVSDTQINLTDFDGNIKNVDVDELTKFYSPSSNNFGISDIKKGQVLGILGLYNKQSQRILAREVNAESDPSDIIYGVITKKDDANFELTITDADKQKTVAEIQDITKTYTYSAGNLEKSGFSKTDDLETAIIVGFPDTQNQGKLLASRVILFPDINLAAKLNITSEIPPSTPSGQTINK